MTTSTREGFTVRCGPHESYRAWVVQRFRNAGCFVRDMGIETMLDATAREQVHACGYQDLTAVLLRYWPDLLVVSPRRKAWLVEVKSCLDEQGQYTYERTGNYAYETDALDAAKRLAVMGVSIVATFHPGVVANVSDIHFTRLPDAHQARGSRAPFGLFPASAPYLQPLTRFISTNILS